MGGRQWPPGSSPHTRGLQGLAAPELAAGGIIPAHAGFTWPRDRCHVADGDHPRTRGVYRLPMGGRQWPPGSSPHTRGLQGLAAPELAAGGIIPAHAGFTSAPCLRVGRLPDHPRTRGVYTSLSGTSRSVRGSSPHTRGLLAICPSGYCPRGIIPAHAGFTAPACGSVLCPAGSSPHTRGLRTVQDWLGMSLRIIPAHAGFTTPGGRRRAPPADHPRTRGVYVAA